MENPSSSTFSLSSLLCQESGTICLGDELLAEEEEEDPYLACLLTCDGFSDSEDEYVQLLLEREKSHSSVLAGNPYNQSQDSSFSFSFSSSSSAMPGRKLTKIARLEAINNILRTKALLGFQFQTAYLSVTYLDRFLSLRTIDSEKAWATELISLGCLSLAAKLHECNVPGLSSFQVGNFRFEVKAVQRMELLILSTLEWKMGSITPFYFLPYFICKLFSGPPPRSTLKRILELILAIMKDISSMDHYPSAIASAAVLMSLDERLTRNALHSKINALPCNRFLDIDDVSTCYLIMQNLERKQTKMLKLPASPDQSPSKLSQMDSFQNSPATASISSKRKRLPFNDSDDKNQAFPDKRQNGSDI